MFSEKIQDLAITGSFLVVIFSSQLVSGNSCDNNDFHPVKRRQYFRHHVIQTMTTQTASLCRIMCHLQESCMSYNYQSTTGSCELSNSDDTKHPDDLVPSPDFDYVRRENPCDKHPCPAYHVCQPNFKEGSRSCLCPRGFEGPNCNEDINERVTGKHDCPSGSQCINTVGSFTCEKIQEADGLENSAILTNYGNSSYVEVLGGFLAPVLQDPSTGRWVRCWHAASDGWNVTTTFHPQCDGKGPTVTIVRGGKYVFGGYSDVPWHSASNYPRFETLESFLFSLFNTAGYKPIKLSLRRKNRNKISFGNSKSGPSFGSDLRVCTRRSWHYCSSYELPPGCVEKKYCSFLTGVASVFPITDVEIVWHHDCRARARDALRNEETPSTIVYVF